METCITTLRTITSLPDNQIADVNDEKEGIEKTNSLNPEIEILTEVPKKKNETKTYKYNLDNKILKIKKIKIKKNRGEKRKFSEKSDSNKIKRKKKEEKSLTDYMTKVQTEDDMEIKIATILSMPQPIVLLKREKIQVDNDSDMENKDIQVKEKSKQLSVRKSKAVASACEETLNTLMKLGTDTLEAMDKALIVLKSHNLLNNKLVPFETLMELVTLALEVNKSEFLHSERESELSKIVTKLMVEMCNVIKTPKRKRSIIQESDMKAVNQEEGCAVNEIPTVEADDKDDNLLNETEKLEKTDEGLEEQEINLLNDSAVEKSGKNFCITNYFKKLKKTVEERDKNERFSLFMAKTDMFLAPKLGGELTGERREKFEEEFNNQTCEVVNLFQLNPKYSNSGNHKIKKIIPETILEKKEEKCKEEACDKTAEQPKDECIIICADNESESKETGKENHQEASSIPVRKKVALIRVDQPKVEPIPVVSRTKAKLFQFHENRRPPYWGTWRRKSEYVKGRRPFAKDKLLNYEIDSDDEWEEEEEPGESLHGSDDEKEPEEDYEVDNDFFVPHGYLSDDENPEKDTMSPKTKLGLLEEQFTSEQKQKTRKMTPFVFGTFWVYKKTASEECLYQDLQIENLHVVPWTSIPIQVVEEDDKKNESTSDAAEPTSQTKKPRQKIFPDEEIPNLIKMIHGSPQNSEILVKKFLHYWNEEKVQDGKRPGLTKVCVLKKIKELATWQLTPDKGKCWLVPKETRKEFGADAETKKPKKCFIWEFVKKVDKASGRPLASASPEPEVVILES